MNQRLKKANRVTLEGLCLNLGLTLLKMFAGFTSHSGAIIADAFHSLSDISTDLALLWGVKAASEPADGEHQYGHGRIETIVSAGIGVFLFVVAGAIFFEGVCKIFSVFRGAIILRPGWFAFFVVFFSIILKEWMYRRTVVVGKETKSQALIANAWHHRSDALSSLGVMFGILGAIVLGENFRILDPIAAVIVSIFITKVAFSIVGESFNELMEGALEPEQEKEILSLVNLIPGTSQAHKLRTRRVGYSIAIELHVRVQKYLNIQEGHAIATQVENILKKNFGQNTFVSVHIEPLKE